MTYDWTLDVVLPLVARLPSTLPWRLAHRFAGMDGTERTHFLAWLQGRFASVFPEARTDEHAHWACSHLTMMAQERIDAMALDRMGAPGGPQVQVQGLEHARAAAASGRGFILVLNHFDRLLTAPLVLARHGIHLHSLTMPVLENPELIGAQRRFLLRKVKSYTSVTQRLWHPTSAGMRPVLESLARGEGWVILADAWRPEFGRLRAHSFLGGQLQLPTGIERVVRSSGAVLLHGRTHSDRPDRLRVLIDPLPAEPRQAIDQVIAQLEHDVRERPWAWWQWGQWEQMWRACPPEGKTNGH